MTAQIITLGSSQEHPKKPAVRVELDSSASLVPPPPPPTKAQLNAIRDSWERVLAIRRPEDLATSSSSAAFMEAFYDFLFSLDQDMDKPFSNVQRRASCLTGIVSYIARAPAIMPLRYRNLKLREMERDQKAELDHDEERWMEDQLQALGARHAHALDPIMLNWFDHIGPALVMALQYRLDREFTSDIGDAWLETHRYVVYHMKRGFKQHLEKNIVIMNHPTRGNCSIQ